MALIKTLIFSYLLILVYSLSVKQTNNEIEEIEKYIEAKKADINQRYRLLYHVAAPVGWINDPNGFSYYKGEYHLFYQFYPYDSVWGPMHWGHVTSKDLVNWNQKPTALIPEQEQCFSGSAVVDGDIFILMYTGHEITNTEPFYNQSQYLALSSDGVNFEKFKGNPVIPASPNGSPDFRDPKAWRHGDHWYVIIGTKTEDNRGRVLLYRSKDMISWDYLTILAESNGELGYMWECPDFFELDGKHVLLMSPQGMEPQGDRYRNVHQTGYIIGRFDYETFKFVPEVDFQELDFGHDFYAAQTMENEGRRYLVAWFNMWEVPHLEDGDGWAGAMTVVRELRLIDNKMLMLPVDELYNLREDLLISGKFRQGQVAEFGKAAEIVIGGNLRNDIVLQLEGRNGGGKVWLSWSSEEGKVSVDRGNGDIRRVEWDPTGSESWRILLDASSLELFCGGGELVFSSRVFPDGEWKLTNLSPQTLDINGFSLNRSVPV